MISRPEFLFRVHEWSISDGRAPSLFALSKVFYRRRPALTTLFATLIPLIMGLFGSTEERREHFLQSGDEVVGLAGALGQVLDLIVLHADLLRGENSFSLSRRST